MRLYYFQTRMLRPISSLVMVGGKQTYWNEDWSKELHFSCFSPKTSTALKHGLPEGKPTSFYCSVCCKTNQLGNMGRGALTKHLSSTHHNTAVENKKSCYGIKIFCLPSAKKVTTATPSTSTSASVNPTAAAPGSSASGGTAEDPRDDPDDPTPASPACTCSCPCARCTNEVIAVPKTAGLQGLNTWLMKQDTTKAEILWCIYCVTSHTSLSSGGKAVQLFPTMFPDSMIAAKMELGRNKIAYSLVHGLAPHFHDVITSKLTKLDFVVVLFDESLNKCSQKTQMDLAIKFWCDDQNETVTKYYDSVFLGRSRATDLISAYCTAIPRSVQSHVLMVGMDGPNVNVKFLKDLQIYMKTEFGEDEPLLLLMGSCGLHVVHNSFKEGVSKCGWNIVMFLRALYNIFKNVPARRSKYTEWTGSTTFPNKYCAVRWLNNAPGADNCIKILPNVKTFIEKVRTGPEEDKIKSAGFLYVAKAVEDKMLGPKLAFFSYVARLVEPFLTTYQTNDPMAPFLHTDLSNLVSNLLRHFVKNDYVNRKSDVCKVDITNEDNLIPVKNFNFSFSVKDALKKVQVSTPEMLKFKEECVLLLKAMVSKILEKAPLNYKLCRAITFCDPELISHSKTAVSTRLNGFLEQLHSRNWLPASECDTILSDFKVLCDKQVFANACQEYDRQRQRLDHFWRGIWDHYKCSDGLVKVIKMALIISHGQAFIERGFSINKEIIVENQLDMSLVAQRQVYDSVNAAGGVENIKISAEMINRFRHARSEYEEAKKQRRSEDAEVEKKRTHEKMIGTEVKELQAKKMKVLASSQKEADAIDEEIKKLTGTF
ncbi:uncharacterized protein LOC124161149 isoform X1 [Ischnura elegans]|uniref:uncharacterized protein LOC124161149 isoform X1 n=2 Tax=Ischnura elegans TaxID=197161 RepID=UPI001ED8BD6B|nr:uncharacterized protein LOC124161149 isoform X1 [Ischnura elegans]